MRQAIGVYTDVRDKKLLAYASSMEGLGINPVVVSDLSKQIHKSPPKLNFRKIGRFNVAIANSALLLGSENVGDRFALVPFEKIERVLPILGGRYLFAQNHGTELLRRNIAAVHNVEKYSNDLPRPCWPSIHRNDFEVLKVYESAVGSNGNFCLLAQNSRLSIHNTGLALIDRVLKVRDSDERRRENNLDVVRKFYAFCARPPNCAWVAY
jgi:hypothetical protein